MVELKFFEPSDFR